MDFIYLRTAYHNIYVFVKYSSFIFPCSVDNFILYMYYFFIYHKKRYKIKIDSQYFYSLSIDLSYYLEYRKFYPELMNFSGKYTPIFFTQHYRISCLLKKLNRCRRYKAGSGPFTLFSQFFITPYIPWKHGSDYDRICFLIYTWWIDISYRKTGTFSGDENSFLSEIPVNS